MVTHPTTSRPACGLWTVNSPVMALKPATASYRLRRRATSWVRFRWLPAASRYLLLPPAPRVCCPFLNALRADFTHFMPCFSTTQGNVIEDWSAAPPPETTSVLNNPVESAAPHHSRQGSRIYSH